MKPSSAHPSFRDRLWLWAHPAGSHDRQFALPGRSSMTPADAARHMGIDNVIMVGFGGQPSPPLQPHAEPLRQARRLVWSIVGDASSTRNDRETDLEPVLDLSRSFPNLEGAIMDDFFLPADPQGRLARWDLAATRGFRNRLHGNTPRPLDLWVVLYDLLLKRPLQPYLEACDVVTYWTWKASDLLHLEQRFNEVEAMAGGKRLLLGCYLWNYGENAPMPADLMEHQCRLGAQWLRQGRIDGMVFLASCICDMQIEAVEWARKWIRAQDGGAATPKDIR